MKKTIHIKPAVVKRKGQPDQALQIRMPDKPLTFMQSHGAAVYYNTYWLRRINDGSVKKITAAEFAKGEVAAKKKAAADAKKKAAETQPSDQ